MKPSRGMDRDMQTAGRSRVNAGTDSGCNSRRRGRIFYDEAVNYTPEQLEAIIDKVLEDFTGVKDPVGEVVRYPKPEKP